MKKIRLIRLICVIVLAVILIVASLFLLIPPIGLGGVSPPFFRRFP